MNKCRVCGKEYEGMPFYITKSVCSAECYHEDYWNNRLDDKAIIIKGHCYHDHGAFDAGSFNRPPVQGFAGREFKIRMTDTDTVIETNNLWDDGLIPEDRVRPDNAEFISGWFTVPQYELI